MQNARLKLETAGWVVAKTYKGMRWFRATSPRGELGVVLRQSEGCWHFFDDAGWTASGTSPHNCHKGGLGDAVGSDSQLKTYCRLVLGAPRFLTEQCKGLQAAQGQCYQEQGA